MIGMIWRWFWDTGILSHAHFQSKSLALTSTSSSTFWTSYGCSLAAVPAALIQEIDSPNTEKWFERDRHLESSIFRSQLTQSKLNGCFFPHAVCSVHCMTIPSMFVAAIADHDMRLFYKPCLPNCRHLDCHQTVVVLKGNSRSVQNPRHVQCW